LGLCTQEVRSPLVGLSDDAKSAMDAALRYAGLID
jgi:4-hydroxy-tetrahydrodipicolinate synthase